MLAVKIPIRSVEEGLMHFVILSDNAQDPKSAVIKEIHHRVKNNLQTIASLLRLQMRRVNSKKVENAFNESINRISSIALIHEELSRGGIDKINIKSATANIMEMVLSSMVPPGKNITGELSGSEIYQDADKASSLSLCITELIQNSVEHAFQMRKKGVIKVDISEVEGEAVITISDNGIGFGGKKNRNSLGLEIIEMITVEKLKGTFVINGQINGTTSVIRFPLKP
jgi:two-component system, sensor histidine kinase PdtaS